jgi:hypothetical protein
MQRDLGRRLVHAARADRIYIGWGDNHELYMFSRAGHPLRMFRWAGPSFTLTNEAWERYTTERVRTAPTEQQRALLTRFYRTSPRPAQFPAHRRLLADALGYLWVEEYPRPGVAHSRWFVLDHAGAWLGTLELPAGFYVYQVGRDELVGKWRDSLGVAYAVAYPLQR